MVLEFTSWVTERNGLANSLSSWPLWAKLLAMKNTLQLPLSINNGVSWSYDVIIGVLTVAA